MKTTLSLAATLCALLLAACSTPTAGGPAGQEGSAAQTGELKTAQLETAQPDVDHAWSDAARLATCVPRCPANTVCVVLANKHTACLPE